MISSLANLSFVTRNEIQQIDLEERRISFFDATLRNSDRISGLNSSRVSSNQIGLLQYIL